MTTPVVLTHSALAAYRACPRRYELAYVRGYRAKKVAVALDHGTRLHRCHEVFWGLLETDVEQARQAGHATIVHEFSGFDLAKYRPVFVSHMAVWPVTQRWRVPAVEQKFSMPLLGPSGQVSTRFILQGKIDRIFVGADDGIVRIGELKTSGADFSEGSAYRSRLIGDEQTSMYYDGAESLGFQPAWLVHDIMGKPKLKPRMATPPDKRVMVKDRVTKQMRLKAGQREVDETPDEFELRVTEAVQKDPSKYIARIRVNRTPEQREEFRLNIWNQSGHVAMDLDQGHFSPDYGSCDPGGRPCAFIPHCHNGVPMNDPYVFEKKASAHDELEDDETVDGGKDDGNEASADDET